MKIPVLLAVAMLVALSGAAGAVLDRQCTQNLADGLGPAYDTVEIGETIEYTISLSVPASPTPPDPPNCTLYNVEVYFFPPPLGSPTQHPCDTDPALGVLIDSGLTLVPGAAPFVYTSADNPLLSYVAQAGDAGGTVYAHISTYFTTTVEPGADPLCDEKESAVDVACPEPCVEITKTVDCEWSKVGDWVTYTICVENCGELFDLTNVVVTDDLLGGSLGFPGTLAPGETVCLDFLYEIQPGDDTGLPGATVVNTAHVSATDACDGVTVVDDDSDQVEVTLLHPDYTVTKECTSPMVPAGGSAEFLVTITNTGDVDLDISTDDAAIPPFTLTTGDPIFTQTVYVPDPGGVEEICNTINVLGTIPVEYCDLPNELPRQATDCCPVVQPCIDVTKEVDCDISKEGDEVVYTICVTNCGDVDLYNVVVNDPMLGGVLPEFSSFLAIGASECHDYTYMIPGGANDPVDNTVIADGETEFGIAAPTATDDESVDLIHPDFTVTKECMSPMVPAGGSAEFLVTITNTGDVDLEISTDDAAIPPFTLTTGDPVFTQSVYVTDPGGVDEICNTINVEARIPEAYCGLPNVLTGSASDCCPVEAPCIDVTKEVDCDVSKEGDEVVYTICVTNCGQIDLYNVVVNDPMLGGVLPEFSSFLAIGASECHDYTYMIPGGADDPVENTVTADGQSEFGVSAPTATDNESVDLLHPDFTVTKECMSPVVPAGGSAEFLVTITNTGDVDLEISTDDAAIPPFTLTTGDPVFTQSVYVTDPGGVDEICNTINVEARIPEAYCGLPNVLTGSASDCCPVEGPCIDVTKEVDCDVSKEGDEVVYTICVTNCGQIDLYNVVVNDPMLGGVLPEFASFLAVGASECHDYTYMIPGGADDPVENTVTADGQSEFGVSAPTATDNESVDLIHPDFRVTKECMSPVVPAGGSAEFLVTITNFGDCDLEISTDDAAIPPFTLMTTDPVFTQTVYVTDPGGVDEICNTINVEARIPAAYCDLPNVLTDSASDCCPVEGPCIDVTKEVDCDVSKEGDEVVYTICVTNCGQIDLYNVVVNDPMLGGVLPEFSSFLAIGASECHDYTYMIPGGADDPVENTVSADGQSEFGVSAPTATDNESVDLIHPDFTVTKECMSPQVPAGGSAEFLVTITNTGDVDLEISTDDAAIPPFTLTTGDPVFTQSVYVTDPGGVDEICNTINVEARIPAAYCDLPNVLTGSATDCCPVVEPCIDVTKEVDCDISKEGDEVIYTICVTNCGDVDLYNVVVNDPMLGGVLPEFSSFLAVGASECHDYTYMIPGGASDPVENTVSADGGTEFGFSAPTAYATETVDLIHPSFTVDKQCMSPQVPAGGSAEFLVTITNTGDVDLDISTDDAAIPPFTLTTGDPVFTQSVYVTDPGGVDEICNTINVEARIPAAYCDLPNVLTGSATDCCPVVEPCIDVTKEVDCDISKEGDEVIYTICVTNCGDVDLYNVVVNDPMLGGVLPEFSSFLAIGASECHDYTYMIPGGANDPVENTVSADGETEFGFSAPTAYATETVDLIHPDFTVTKVCQTPEVQPGEDAEFLVTITNTGDCSLDISTDEPTIPPFALTTADPVFTQVITVPCEAPGEPVCNDITVTATIPAEYCDLPNVIVKSDGDCCECPAAQGRWTGGGTIDWAATIPEGAHVTHGFQFHCDLRRPNRLEVNWTGGNRWHMMELLEATCLMNPDLPPPDPPVAPINEVFAIGEGRYNNQRGYIAEFHFTDVGEPGLNDLAVITITAPDGTVVLQAEGHLEHGNHQAHTDNRGGDADWHDEFLQLPDPDEGREAAEQLPTEAAVSQSTPNPFRDTARIQFQLPTSGAVAIDVYDVAGRHVVSLMDEEKPAGYHEAVWDGRNSAGSQVPAGVYFYRVRLDDEILMRKMILMR